MSERANEELFTDVDSRRPKPVADETVIREPRMRAIQRDQLILRPMNIEELVAPDHEVRAIWELTGRLDLSAYYESI
jgi:hypothetical protein